MTLDEIVGDNDSFRLWMELARNIWQSSDISGVLYLVHLAGY